MALPPKLAGLAFPNPLIKPQAVHTLELYLDYVCPFSNRLFTTLTSILPTLSTPPLRIILRPQIQPWHPASLLCVEAALAVQRLAPHKFWPFSTALFADQQFFFDECVVTETRMETYRRLAAMADKVGVDGKEILALLKVDALGVEERGNQGNQVTADVKLTVRASRLVGVHVTPTVIFNGIVEASISSSFTAGQWREWLDKNVV